MLTAIFGGTFNPFHIGHYEMLKVLNNDTNIEKILLMPDNLPPHKSSDGLIDNETRIEMCKIIAQDFSKCEVCLIEFEREGKSYSYDTVKLLQERYSNKNFAFVCGGDMLVYFEKWYRYKDLMKMLPFIVFERIGTKKDEFIECIRKLRLEGMEIILKSEIIPDVSSTQLRENFLENKELLPNNVFEFLAKRGVYGG